MLIRPHHILFPAQRAHQHQQRRLRQMKIRQQRPHHPKLVPGRNKQIRLARPRANSSCTGCPISRAFCAREVGIFTLLRRIFQSAHSSRPNRDNPPSFASRPINFLRRLLGDRIPLRMQSNVFHPLHPYRLKSSQPHMQRHLTSLNPALPHPLQNSRSEMQPRRRSRHRPALPRIHCLIPLTISRRIRPPNIRRQRHMPNLLQDPVEVFSRVPHFSRVPAREVGAFANRIRRSPNSPRAITSARNSSCSPKNNRSPTPIFRPGRTKHSHSFGSRNTCRVSKTSIRPGTDSGCPISRVFCEKACPELVEGWGL
jgi:hypothetical protein